MKVMLITLWIFILTVFFTVPQFDVAQAAPGVGLAQHYANLATPDTSKWRNGAIGTGDADYAETRKPGSQSSASEEPLGARSGDHLSALSGT